MSENTISSRLKELIRFLNLSDSQFADRCEISRATLSLLLSGKNKKISDVLLSQIHQTFPEISILWLLFGEGEISLKPHDAKKDLFSDGDLQLFPDEGSQEEKKSILTPLNNMGNVLQDAVTKAIDTYFDSKSLSLFSTSEKSKPRKVKQITVYYDDSTFETFLPGV